MSTAKTDNEELIRRFREEVYEEGNLDRIDEYVAADCVSHSPVLPEPGHGPEEYREFTSMLLSAFPDYEDTTEDLVAEDDKVVVRMTMTGTHEGEFLDLEPTGTTVGVEGMIIYRIEDGKIVEGWYQADMFGLMQQLGLA